jgi:glutamine---fructose-6-phosphate transaminase (isomerizing)
VCGIVGYIGPKKVVPLILEGLRMLEYRGYDSAGIAVVTRDGKMDIRRASGKLRNLEEAIHASPIEGIYGVGHTRWATHGRPTEENAHPHRDCTGEIVVVHNGIIENYLELKRQLIAEGHKFKTETDTEVVAHLVEKYWDGGPLEVAVRKAVKQLRGVFALVILTSRDANKIVAVRMGPPVVIGLGDSEFFAASDIPALLAHTKDIIFLGDGDVAVLTLRGVHITDFDGCAIERPVQRITWDAVRAEKGGYRHFMLKEIFEQPRALRDTILNRISLDSGKVFLDPMNISESEFRDVTTIKVLACGTSWHAGLAGKYMIERLAKIPVEVDYADEFRYRGPIIHKNTLCICISQSGETADTLGALREANRLGAKTLAICNVPGSMITREAAGTIVTHAGPEISVASTKAFTGQLAALALVALYLGQVHESVTADCARTMMQELTRIPLKMETVLQGEEAGVYDDLARQLAGYNNFLYLGRGMHFPVAMEGALKLKEISYIHAEGYPAGEMKHGPNALIDNKLPVVFVATRDENDPESMTRYEKTVSNIKEVKAREGIVFTVATSGDQLARETSDYIVEVPMAPDLFVPMIEVIPLQLLAYHIAVRRGCDVDQPRNLAKSVTVE